MFPLKFPWVLLLNNYFYSILFHFIWWQMYWKLWTFVNYSKIILYFISIYFVLKSFSDDHVWSIYDLINKLLVIDINQFFFERLVMAESISSPFFSFCRTINALCRILSFHETTKIFNKIVSVNITKHFSTYLVGTDEYGKTPRTSGSEIRKQNLNNIQLINIVYSKNNINFGTPVDLSYWTRYIPMTLHQPVTIIVDRFKTRSFGRRSLMQKKLSKIFSH